MEQFEGLEELNKYLNKEVKNAEIKEEKKLILSFEKKVLFVNVKKNIEVLSAETLTGVSLKAVIGAIFTKADFKSGRIYMTFQKDNAPSLTLSFKAVAAVKA